MAGEGDRDHERRPPYEPELPVIGLPGRAADPEPTWIAPSGSAATEPSATELPATEPATGATVPPPDAPAEGRPEGSGDEAGPVDLIVGRPVVVRPDLAAAARPRRRWPIVAGVVLAVGALAVGRSVIDRPGPGLDPVAQPLGQGVVLDQEAPV